MSGRVVAVGAGQAGFQLAASLRDAGYPGPILLVGDEPLAPYARPPLSKAYLSGKADTDALLFRNASYFAERGIDLRLGERAIGIDRTAGRVRLASGEALSYDHLVLATGSRNRVLSVPGAELDGVVAIRTEADAVGLRTRLPRVRRAAVVGAGFIGLEFAAVAASTGIAVTVLEATGRPMSRIVSSPTSAFFREAHEAAGTTFDFGAVVTTVTGQAGRATGVETDDGRHHPADIVLVGIGVVPNVELASEAGLAVANGILVDEYLRTTDPDISAIGDCASFPAPIRSGTRLRIESVQNAVDQARMVAARLAGRPVPYAATPWFWSDQGATKLQIAGLAGGDDESVLRGDPSSGAFSVFRFADGRLTAVESVNRPGDHMLARRLLARQVAISPAEAADTSLDLKARWAGILSGTV